MKVLLILFVGLSFCGMTFTAFELHSQVSFWKEQFLEEKRENIYYWSGANERGLLNLCRDKNGKLRALFKEDCRA